MRMVPLSAPARLQVPSWLNASHPGVSVVTHAQIFRRRADLPTFSSNAIEANLHRIPGLAARWIYFNDDVFLAQPVFPSDWAILSSPERTTYKLYLTWPIPTCAEVNPHPPPPQHIHHHHLTLALAPRWQMI